MPFLGPLFMVVCLIGLLLCLNARDRRRDALLAGMLDSVPRALRSAIAIHVRCSLLSGRAVVDVDMTSCTCTEVCAQVAQWRRGLPPGVRLMARGRTGRGLTHDFTIDIAAT